MLFAVPCSVFRPNSRDGVSVAAALRKLRLFSGIENDKMHAVCRSRRPILMPAKIPSQPFLLHAVTLTHDVSEI